MPSRPRNNSLQLTRLAALLHLGQQFSLNLLGSWPGYTGGILMWVIAILVVTTCGVGNLSRRSPLVQYDHESHPRE